MKFKIIFFFLIIVSLKSSAQNISVDYSPVITNVDQKYGRVIWLSNGNDFKYISSQGKNIMKATTVTQLKGDMSSGNTTEFGVSGLNEKTSATLWQAINNSTGFEALISVPAGDKTVALKKVQLNESGSVESEQESIGTYPASAMNNTANSSQSPDGKYHLVYNLPGYYYSNLSYVVFDSDNKAVRDFIMPTGYENGKLTIVNAVIDNAGNIFTLATIQETFSTFAYQLKLYRADDNKGVDVAISSLEKLKYVDDLFLNTDTKGVVYLSGRYLEKKDANMNAEGFFMQKINAETAKTELWMNANFNSDATALKSLSRTMRVDKIVSLPDGNFGMVGECTFNTADGLSIDFVNDRRYTWMESVLIMKVSAAGKILSSKIIERNQNIVDPAKRLFCGSAILMKGTKCFMIYNESLGSIEKRKAGDKPINYSAYRDKSSMVLAEIDLANGSYTEKYLTDIKPYTEKLKPILIPGFSQLCNDDKTIAVKLDIGVKGSCRYVFVNVE